MSLLSGLLAVVATTAAIAAERTVFPSEWPTRVELDINETRSLSRNGGAAHQFKLLIPRYPLVAATQDWHPPEHLSFASSHAGRQPFETIELDGVAQMIWPDHCQWDSPGAQFAPALVKQGDEQRQRQENEHKTDQV